jgi:hypothetical protein
MPEMYRYPGTEDHTKGSPGHPPGRVLSMRSGKRRSQQFPDAFHKPGNGMYSAQEGDEW